MSTGKESSDDFFDVSKHRKSEMIVEEIVCTTPVNRKSTNRTSKQKILTSGSLINCDEKAGDFITLPGAKITAYASCLF